MDVEPVRIVGVDLAAQPGDTAYCVITVNEGQSTIVVASPRSGEDATDANLVDAFQGTARIGIDAPFGWPVEFIAALPKHRDHGSWPADDPEAYAPKDSTIEYRSLKYRGTDLHVWANTGKKPLSVTTDYISAVAMRAAALLSRANADLGLDVDRSGRTGRFVEVYPAAALARWNIKTSSGPKRSYKTNAKERERVLREITEHLDGWPQGSAELWNTSHKVDSLVSALVTLMAELDHRLSLPKEDRLIEPIPAGCEALAKMEGWIALPRSFSLRDLRARLKEFASV